jgi:RNA polymerase sigma-54 factor
MALEIKQSLKLSQQLIMTPQLQQAIKLLQLSRLELVDLVQNEMQENPVLDEAPEDYQTEEAKADNGEQNLEQQMAEVKPAAGIDSKSDIDWDNYLENYSASAYTASYEDEERPSFESTMTRKTSLTDHLLWQLRLAQLAPEEEEIGSLIIGNLDEDGYLQADIAEIAAQEGIAVEVAAGVLKKVQEFDPVGVAARNLQECLLIQAYHLGLTGSLAEQILERHLPNLENKNYNAIARDLGVTFQEVIDAVRIIARFEPKPGRPYSSEEPQYITPDIYVHKVGDEYIVVLNEDGMPKLRISSFYRNALHNPGSDVAKAYIQEKLRSAVWLIRSIHQRQRTIYKVTKSIITFQREFFDKGVAYLRPLVLRDVAEDIQMHESTISRVTSNKYVHTPQGIFELKYFFNSSINRTDGDQIASQSVKDKIRQIVASENPRKPYSDQKIVEILRQADIDIARRTVTKYREMMGILSSTQRKRLF